MLGTALDIQTNDSKVLMDALKQKSTEELLYAAADMYMDDEDGVSERFHLCILYGLIECF